MATPKINPRLVMRLLPMRDPERSWRSIKGQWKKDAESVGEDFSTFSTGSFSAYDALTKDGDNPQPVLPFRQRAGSCGLPGQSPDDEQISVADPARAFYRRIARL